MVAAAGGDTIQFDALHKAVHYPLDRRFRIWIEPSFVASVVVLTLLPFLIAWGEVAVFGVPFIPCGQKSRTR
jgi:sulfoxide reductase catalytic subunit YedY